MRKIFKSIVLVIVILVPAGFLSICIYANRSTEDKGGVKPLTLNYFYESYDENRDRFVNLSLSLKNQFKGVEISRRLVPSKVDTDLSIDTVYIPAQRKPEKIIIMTSGVHGIEGFTGSAIQRYFMREVLDSNELEGIGVLIIHAVNPYGYKYGRRVSENNIDMNRNFDVGIGLFEEKNEYYAKVDKLLNPQKRATAGFFENGVFFIRTAGHILKYSMKTLRVSILKGQYEFMHGIFYGGNDFESQKQWLEDLILEKVKDYKYIFVIDIHTGYGQRGKLHILPGNVHDTERNTLLEKMFEGYKLDRPGKKFIAVKGGFRDYVGNLISSEKKYTGTLFEFGTLDSHKLAGAIRSLHNTILENQGFHHGYKNEKKEKRIKVRFREMFFPSSEIWRSKIMEQAGNILPVLMNRYAELRQ